MCSRKKIVPGERKARRDPSKRNLQGEKLESYLMKRAKAIEKRQPYVDAVRQVLQRMKQQQADKLAAEETARNTVDLESEELRLQLIRDNMSIVASHNEHMALVHTQRNAHQAERKEAKMKKEEERMRLQDERLREFNTKIVQDLIEESRDFITMDNMDEKLEYALSNPVNFNYAIMVHGEKILSTKPPGNLDGWDGPPPSAFIAGGISESSEEFQQTFQGTDVGFYLRRGGFFGKDRKKKQVGNTSGGNKYKNVRKV